MYIYIYRKSWFEIEYIENRDQKNNNNREKGKRFKITGLVSIWGRSMAYRSAPPAPP